MKSILGKHGLNTAIAGVAILVLMFFLLSYSETGTPPAFTEQTPTKQRSDYYLKHSTSTEFNALGQREAILQSKYTVHVPAGNKARLLSPHLELYENDQLIWTVDSQIGLLSQQGQLIELEQRVIAASGNQQTIFNTPQLTIEPNKKLAKTSKPVTLRNPNGFTRAIGLQADLAKQEVYLLDQVRGQYQGLIDGD